MFWLAFRATSSPVESVNLYLIKENHAKKPYWFDPLAQRNVPFCS